MGDRQGLFKDCRTGPCLNTSITGEAQYMNARATPAVFVSRAGSHAPRLADLALTSIAQRLTAPQSSLRHTAFEASLPELGLSRDGAWEYRRHAVAFYLFWHE